MGLEGMARRVVRRLEVVSSHDLPALAENFETGFTPPRVERMLSQDEALALTANLISPETRQRIDAKLADLPDGRYRAREIAGTPEEGNRHPHDFIIEKTGDVARLFFIDPEHAMGLASKNTADPLIPGTQIRMPRRGDLRPKVHIVYAAELHAGDPVPKLSALRYRAAAVPEDQPLLNKPAAQLRIAETMLETGDTPTLLEDKEHEISFRLDMRPADDTHTVLIQARSARDDQDISRVIDTLAAGDTPSGGDPIEGQLHRFRSIFRTHFPRLLEEGEFEAINQASS